VASEIFNSEIPGVISQFFYILNPEQEEPINFGDPKISEGKPDSELFAKFISFLNGCQLNEVLAGYF
jgi:hypothetical protein